MVQACCQNDWKLEQLGCSVPARVRPRPHSTCPTGDQRWPSFFLRPPPHGCSPALLGDHDKPVCTRRLEFVTNSFFILEKKCWHRFHGFYLLLLRMRSVYLQCACFFSSGKKYICFLIVDSLNITCPDRLLASFSYRGSMWHCTSWTLGRRRQVGKTAPASSFEVYKTSQKNH